MNHDKVKALGFIIGGLVTLGIYMLVGVIWVILEQAILGATNPNSVDTIMCTILTMSLLFNLKTYINKVIEEENI